MEEFLQLCYPVLTLEGEELLPAGSRLTKGTMADLIRCAEKHSFPALHLMEYGSIAADLERICRHPPYCQMFTDPTRRKDIFTLMQGVKLPVPVLDIYRYFRSEDPYTYWHILTVFALSLLLMQDLVEDRRDLAGMVAAATCHDFGKICVPLDVLRKETPLTIREQQLLSHHVAAGYVILSYYFKDADHPAAITARDHHERRDGGGYPLGISLNNLAVEIVSGADIFDALISQRPYRPQSYDLRTALEAMALQAGQGEISIDMVHALIRGIRKDLPCQSDSAFSMEVRGTPPPGNRYRGAVLCRYEVECRIKRGEGDDPDAN